MAVVADHIEFAFCRAGREVAGDEDVAVSAEIPVGVGLAANTGLSSSEFLASGESSSLFSFAEAFAGGPVGLGRSGGRREACKLHIYITVYT